MKTEKINELIKSLRCSASTYNNKIDCKGCAYRYLEEVNDKIACPPDVEVNGVKYWRVAIVKEWQWMQRTYWKKFCQHMKNRYQGKQ